MGRKLESFFMFRTSLPVLDELAAVDALDENERDRDEKAPHSGPCKEACIGCILELPSSQHDAVPIDIPICFAMNCEASHLRRTVGEEANGTAKQCIATTCISHPMNICNGGVVMRVFDGCKPPSARQRNASNTERQHTVVCVFDGVAHRCV